MISIKDTTNIVVNTWGINKTINTLMTGVASFVVAVAVCAVIIPNSTDGIVIFTETEKEN